MNLSDLTPMDRARMRQDAQPFSHQAKVELVLPRQHQVFGFIETVYLTMTRWGCLCGERFIWPRFPDEDPAWALCPNCDRLDPALGWLIVELCRMAESILRNRIDQILWGQSERSRQDARAQFQIFKRCGGNARGRRKHVRILSRSLELEFARIQDSENSTRASIWRGGWTALTWNP